MKPVLKMALGACVILAVALSSLALRRTRVTPIVPDPAEVLSATQPEDGGSEPAQLPAGPILRNSATGAGHVAFNFGYRLGATTYAYRFGMAFDPEADGGTADLGAMRTSADATESFPATRRWSDSRHAFLVVVSHDFTATSAPAPNLCIRATLGPSKAAIDLASASLCVMQRDADGRCHPSSLACGLLR